MSLSQQLLPPDYEPRDASPQAVVFTAILLASALAVVLAAAAWIYRARYAHAPTARYDAAEKLFQQGPSWQTGIARDWADQDQRVREHLTTYGWVNRKAGIVRIPIERAMALVAAESAPEVSR